MAPITHPARTLLEKFNRAHPGIWPHVDRARTPPRSWPPQVFLPQPHAAGVLAQMDPALGKDVPTLLDNAHWVAMFAAWRVTQGIYRFDPDIYSALMATPITGEISMETLVRLPEWCVYLETPGTSLVENGVSSEQLGFWAWLDWYENTPTPLTLSFCRQFTKGFKFAQLPLTGTVEQSIKDLLQSALETIPGMAAAMPAQSVEETAREVVDSVRPLLPLLLYLCSEAPEIGDGTRAPGNPQPRYTKGRERMFPAPKPIEWSVGVRMGAALRRAREREAAAASEEEGEGRRTVRPHVRRAHWAHRWTGPRTGERESVLRWIHPALVNVDSPEELPSVIRPVEGHPAGEKSKA